MAARVFNPIRLKRLPGWRFFALQPVIMMSSGMSSASFLGMAEVDYFAMADALGATRTIEKPFKYSELVRLVQECLGRNHERLFPHRGARWAQRKRYRGPAGLLFLPFRAGRSHDAPCPFKCWLRRRLFSGRPIDYASFGPPCRGGNRGTKTVWTSTAAGP